MKKILFALLIITSFHQKANSQINKRLDTVFARNLIFSYEELSWVEDNWHRVDSLEKKFFKKMQTAVNAVSNKVNATNITIDSIPGQVALTWYRAFRNSSEGVMASFSNNIKNKIKNYTPLTADCQDIDDRLDKRRTDSVKNGKDDW